jgi:glyoxylase-like metal-dependent hydrolase (beta-lactamase superfamily II)
VIGGPIALFWAVVGIVLWLTFDGVSALEDGEELGPAVRVVDGYVSCFLLDDGEGGIVLLDVCEDPDATALRAALTARGKSVTDVRAILLSHGHHDHRGGLGHFPGAHIYAHEAELPLLEGEVAAQGPIPQLSGRMAAVGVDTALTDGTELTLGALEVRVFHLPGHTDGSVAYLVDDILFVADNAHAMDDGTLEAAPWVFSDDQAENRASLRALARRLRDEAHAVAHTVPSHSGSLPGRTALDALAF